MRSLLFSLPSTFLLRIFLTFSSFPFPLYFRTGINIIVYKHEDLHKNESSGDTQKRVKSANRERSRDVPMYDNLSCVKLPPALATYDPIPISKTRRQGDTKKGKRISSAPGQREKLSLPGYKGGYIGGLAGMALHCTALLAGRIDATADSEDCIKASVESC